MPAVESYALHVYCDVQGCYRGHAAPSLRRGCGEFDAPTRGAAWSLARAAGWRRDKNGHVWCPIHNTRAKRREVELHGPIAETMLRPAASSATTVRTVKLALAPEDEPVGVAKPSRR